MDGVESFSFSLSDVNGNGSQGSLQCVEKSQNGEMTSLGNIDTKIQIQAKTASIAHTKSKIEAADEKRKKAGAKVFNSASSSQATSSQVEQTSQVVSSAPRERKKAVPLLKKLLSRNFLKGLRSGNTSISRTVLNSAPQRAAVLLTEPPPIINSKEQKIVEMKKKRMLEDSAGETYSDPRRKKQRISHYSQSEPSSVDKVNPIINIIKSENVLSARTNKAHSQETKKRRLRGIKIQSAPIDTVCESRTPHALSTIKSEKVFSVNANNTRCQETKRGISLCNQIKSVPGIKVDCNAAPTVQRLSISNSKAVVVKPGVKMTPQAAKKRLKNRRKRRKQKQKKRDLKKEALMKSSASRIPLVRESQSHQNTPRKILAAVVKTEKPTNIMNLILPKNTLSETSFSIHSSETPAAVAKTQKPNDTLTGTSAAVAKTQKPENTWSEIPVPVVKTQELKELCKRIEQPLVITEKQKLVELKKQREFTLDATEPCKEKLKVAQDNQNDLPFVNKEFIISNLDSTSTELNGSILQDSNFTQKETKSKGGVEEQGKLSKTSTKSLDCLEPSVLDIFPAKSTKREVQLPDLVQHCERVITTDPSDNEDSIILSLTSEQIEMLSEDSKAETNSPLHHSSSRIPGTSQSSSKDSVLRSNKCKSRNRTFNQPCCNYGCEVTSTSRRTQTSPRREIPYSATSSKSAAIVSLAPTKTAIPGGTAEFKEITTSEQRELYKTVFAEKFEEYEKLQEDLSIYDKYLQSLVHSMKAYSKGSDDYNKVKVKFYESFNYYKRRIQEYAALHTQLEHIKELVMRFDSKF